MQKKEKLKIVQLIFFDVLISILDIGFLIFLLLIVDFYSSPSKSQYLNAWMASVINGQPLLLIGIFSLLFALKNLLAFILSKKQFYFVYRVASRVSEEKMSAFLDGGYMNYVNTDSSVHLRSINQDPIDFSHYVLRGMQQVIGQSILIFFAIIPILLYKPFLFSLLLIILFPPVLLIAILSRKKSNSLHKSAKFIYRKLIQHSKEAISGFIESNIYQKKNFFLNRFRFYQEEQSKHLALQQIAQALPSRLIEIFAVFGLFVLISINFFTKGKSVDLITIGAFMAAAYKIIPGIVKILNSLSQIKIYSFTVTNLFNYSPHVIPKKTSVYVNIDAISFFNVSFNYNDNSVLKQISIQLKKGELTGITGLSGKGKTTLINLLLGFLAPTGGNISVNGAVKSAAELQSLWNNISYIQQSPFLLHDTLLKNITLDETEYDADKLYEVLQHSGLKQMVEENPEGLNKIITEKGKNISGGQRQRIALARALYKDTGLIILDEPFNELDRKSENCILHRLKKLAKSGKMILLITHDKESLSFCNKIISLDEV